MSPRLDPQEHDRRSRHRLDYKNPAPGSSCVLRCVCGSGLAEESMCRARREDGGRCVRVLCSECGVLVGDRLLCPEHAEAKR